MIVDLEKLQALLSALDEYESRSPAPLMLARRVCACARPMLAVLAYNGPDVTELYAPLDAARTLLQRLPQGSLATSYAERAEEILMRDLCSTVLRIFRAAMAAARERSDNEIAQAANAGDPVAQSTPTALERALLLSVAGR